MFFNSYNINYNLQYFPHNLLRRNIGFILITLNESFEWNVCNSCSHSLASKHEPFSYLPSPETKLPCTSDLLYIYNTLKHCVDKWAIKSWCKGRGFLVDEVFLEVHQKYFSLCGQIQDPPVFTLVMLITPVIIATLFLPLLCVHLVTWKL
uniref:Uncharacterized protein n=1 Tax=Gouania willdenowi TaxID=441366 RepID=A0A8C5HGI4_GOUWI